MNQDIQNFRAVFTRSRGATREREQTAAFGKEVPAGSAAREAMYPANSRSAAAASTSMQPAVASARPPKHPRQSMGAGRLAGSERRPAGPGSVEEAVDRFRQAYMLHMERAQRDVEKQMKNLEDEEEYEVGQVREAFRQKRLLLMSQIMEAKARAMEMVPVEHPFRQSHHHGDGPFHHAREEERAHHNEHAHYDEYAHAPRHEFDRTPTGVAFFTKPDEVM